MVGDVLGAPVGADVGSSDGVVVVEIGDGVGSAVGDFVGSELPLNNASKQHVLEEHVANLLLGQWFKCF